MVQADEPARKPPLGCPAKGGPPTPAVRVTTALLTAGVMQSPQHGS